MPLGLLTLFLTIPGCASLKEKRGRVKPLINRLHREFNISVAEVDQMDLWQNTTIACAMVSNEQSHIQRVLQQVVHWIETSWSDLDLVDEQLELF
jgi:uncharacterized protein